MPNLIIPAGIPGCGKSTWARTFFDLKYGVVCPDDLRRVHYGSLSHAHDPVVRAEANMRVWGEAHDKLEDYLRHGVDAIIDATNLWRAGRYDLIDLGRQHKAKVHLVLFKNVQQAIDRNAAREDDSRVPDEDMERMVSRYYDTLAEFIQEDYDTVTTIERFG